jgi:hypothetical protein
MRDEVFAALVGLGLLSDAGNQVLLTRDLRGVTLFDLYRRLPYGIDADTLARVRDLPQLVGPLMDYIRYGAEHLEVDVDRVASAEVESGGETPA